MSRSSHPRVWLIRHGESHANRAGELVGNRDIRLTPAGLGQADAAASYLRSRIPGRPAIVSSPLDRALSTARAIAGAFDVDVDVDVDARLTELDYGALEGSAFGDLLDDWPPDWVSDPEVPTPGGESYAMLEKRVAESLGDAESACLTGDVADLIVVTHLGPIKALLKLALREQDGSVDAGGLYDHLMVSHASASVIDNRGGRSIVVAMNVDIGHTASR